MTWLLPQRKLSMSSPRSVYVLPSNEDWIIDRFAKEWSEDNADITISDPRCANVIWVLADFCWNKLPPSFLASRKVITTIHHIVPEKFGAVALAEFNERDLLTTAYHVPNKHTADFIRPLTQKPIHLIPYWANQRIWRPTMPTRAARELHKLPKDCYLVGSFQRDTEGAGIPRGDFRPKLEKGPDLFCDYIGELAIVRARMGLSPVHVVLAGWRRQYVIERLKNIGVGFTYKELPDQNTVNELYQSLDLYAVTARYEGGPQALIECGLLNVPVVSTSVGIAEQVLPASAIRQAAELLDATPAVPDVTTLKLPSGYEPFRNLIEAV